HFSDVRPVRSILKDRCCMSAELRYINRELSWLEFNQRVLDEASDQTIPLLERLKFLAITASNLDEFSMVRVGSLQLLEAEGDMRPAPAGMTTSQQLKAIGERMQAFMTEQYRCLISDIEPQLAEAGMRRLTPKELNERQAHHLQTVFEQEIFPILTPLAVLCPAPNPAGDGTPAPKPPNLQSNSGKKK